MQPLYTESEFKNAKSRDLLPLKCIECDKTFYKTKHHIQDFMREKTKDKGDFCSLKCNGKHSVFGVTLPCEYCGKSFIKLESQIKQTKHNFCCKSCAATYHNTHKTNGTRISKLEVWLSKQLPVLYPDLEFNFNRKDAINSELDIYIPSLKLAFELNGIFHYEPIYGSEKLSSTQNNDNRKYQACIERQIELCIIDVSRQKYFKEQTCLPFLDIIKNIINLKLSKIN